MLQNRQDLINKNGEFQLDQKLHHDSNFPRIRLESNIFSPINIYLSRVEMTYIIIGIGITIISLALIIIAFRKYEEARFRELQTPIDDIYFAV